MFNEGLSTHLYGSSLRPMTTVVDPMTFVASSTIRINGIDIAFELRESSCGSEGSVDGCGDQIACHVWVFGGREYTEPPVELIVDAILRRVYGQAGDYVEDGPYELPDNLQRFFAGASAAPDFGDPGAVSQSACCAPDEQESCCAPEDKAGCCTEAVDCGCR